ncbi:chlorite dismutase family protein [Methylobacterium sp. A54F]
MVDIIRFEGGPRGEWRVTGMRRVRGEGLPAVARVAASGPASAPPAPGATWALRGLLSHVRYTTRAEVESLRAAQEGLGRAAARCAALIPIRKSQAWWDMAQDERRAVFEEVSRHTSIGLAYLPAIARRLHHSRDLGEPFDFLTWFEFAPEDADAFERLVERLRATREWDYVDREIDIRLERTG